MGKIKCLAHFGSVLCHCVSIILLFEKKWDSYILDKKKDNIGSEKKG